MSCSFNWTSTNKQKRIKRLCGNLRVIETTVKTWLDEKDPLAHGWKYFRPTSSPRKWCLPTCRWHHGQFLYRGRRSNEKLVRYLLLNCTIKNIHYILFGKSESFQHKNSFSFSWPSEKKIHYEFDWTFFFTDSGWDSEVWSLFWKTGFQLSHISAFIFGMYALTRQKVGKYPKH